MRDLPPLRVLDLLDRPEPVPDAGTLLRYPNHLRLPLLFVEHDGGAIGMRCEDAQGRAKRFAIYAERFGPLAGRYAVELIFEDDARFFAPHVEAPDWAIGPAPDLDAFRAAQLAFAEAQMGLVPWSSAPTCQAGRGHQPGADDPLHALDATPSTPMTTCAPFCAT